MKKIIFFFLTFSLLAACDDFLEESPPTGLTSDKLNDLVTMRALNNGAYKNFREFYAYATTIPSLAIGDSFMLPNDGAGNYINATTWATTGFSQVLTGEMYNSSMSAFHNVNYIINADITNMAGTENEKNAVLGDAHLIKAILNFTLDKFFTRNASGNSFPLLNSVVGPNEKVSLSTSIALRAQAETDIELARQYLKQSAGVNTYMAATAFAAKIYFFHKKYDLAYERANEVITSGQFSLESDMSNIYLDGDTSTETILTIVTDLTDTTPSNWGGYATVNFDRFEASKSTGLFTLNPYSLVAQLRNADPSDLRFTQLFEEKDGFVFMASKYPTNETDQIIVRLPEMYLTRAESNIMNSNSVTSTDVADINVVKNRAGAADTITGTPSASAMLDIIYNERSKELCFELFDRLLNSVRLEKDIVDQNGSTYSYGDYINKLYYPFPQEEIDYHNFEE